MIPSLSLSLILGLFFLMSCASTHVAEYDSRRVYFSGEGTAKFHVYDGADKCKTAFGLDPDAFDLMVTAVSFRIHEKFPGMRKVGRRGGPYDPKARCLSVTGVDSGRSVVVRAIDKCCKGSLTSANSHQLDLSEEAFIRIGEKWSGNLRVKWSVIDCPVGLRVESDSDVCDDNYYFTR